MKCLINPAKAIKQSNMKAIKIKKFFETQTKEYKVFTNVGVFRVDKLCGVVEEYFCGKIVITFSSINYRDFLLSYIFEK